MKLQRLKRNAWLKHLWIVLLLPLSPDLGTRVVVRHPSLDTQAHSPAAQTLALEVTAEGDAPLENAHVTLVGKEGRRNFNLPKSGRKNLTFPSGRYAVAYVRAEGRGMEARALSKQTRRLQITMRSPVTLRGVVMDDQGKALAKARVEISIPLSPATESRSGGAAFHTLRAVTASSAGVFTVPGLGGFPKILRSQKAGHEVAQRRVERHANLQRVRLVLPRLTKLEGLLLGSDGRPSTGRVRLAGSSVWPPEHTEADATGKFRFADVPAGVYDLDAVHGSASARNARALMVTPGQTRQVKLELRAGVRWQGRVVSALSGNAVRGARVSLNSSVSGFLPLAATTDRAGAFIFQAVQPGEHLLQVLTRTFLPLKRKVEVSEESTTVTFKVAPGASLAGRVHTPGGQPAGGAQLIFLGTDSRNRPVRLSGTGATAKPTLRTGFSDGQLGVMEGPIPPIPQLSVANPASARAEQVSATQSWETERAGTFSLEGLPQIQGKLLVMHPDFAPTFSAPLKLAAGKATKAPLIKLQRGGMVVGRVVDKNGRGLEEQLVRATQLDLPEPLVGMTDGSGAFRFGPLLGEVELSALPLELPEESAQVTVAEGQQAQVTLQVDGERHQIGGTVLGRGGLPVADAQITLLAAGDSPGAPAGVVTLADEGGQFSFTTLRTPPLRLHVRAGDYPEVTSEVDLERQPMQIQLASGLAVTARLVDTWRREGARGARAHLLREGAKVSQATASTEGDVRLQADESGSYTLRVESGSFAPVTRTFEVGDRDVDLGRIELSPAGSLEGDVVDSLARPVAGATVWVNGGPKVQTDKNGHFVLQGLAEGESLVEASHPVAGATESSYQVRIRSGEQTPGAVLHLPGRSD